MLRPSCDPHDLGVIILIGDTAARIWPHTFTHVRPTVLLDKT